MAEASFLPDGPGAEVVKRPPGWRGRRVLAGTFVPLVAVSALMIRASAQRPPDGKPAAPADEQRRAPRVLAPVESRVGFARVQVRGYALGGGHDTPLLVVPRGGEEKARRNAVPLDKLAPALNVRPAEQVVPVRMALIAASFPFKAQVEEFRTKLRLRSAAAVLEERGPDGLPTFRFLGVRVERRELGADGKALTPWAELDVGAAYKPYLLRSGKRFEPEEPPDLERVIFPGLVMPKLLAFRRHQYPAVEAGLKTLRKSWEQAPEPKPGVPPPADPFAPAAAEVRPGIAKPRPEPVPPAAAKPRKPAPPKAPPAPVAAAALVPDYCLVRVIDVTVEPGKVYQYRLRVRMANPNFGRKDVAAPELARDREIGPE
jgi:hypothetical protein